MWRHPDQIDRHVDVWISPKSISEFNKLTGAINMTYEVLTKNIFDKWDKKYSMNNIEDFDMIYQKYDEVNYLNYLRHGAIDKVFFFTSFQTSDVSVKLTTSIQNFNEGSHFVVNFNLDKMIARLFFHQVNRSYSYSP